MANMTIGRHHHGSFAPDLSLGSCPRCLTGTIETVEDYGSGRYEHCLQCGYVQNLGLGVEEEGYVKPYIADFETRTWGLAVRDGVILIEYLVHPSGRTTTAWVTKVTDWPLRWGTSGRAIRLSMRKHRVQELFTSATKYRMKSCADKVLESLR